MTKQQLFGLNNSGCQSLTNYYCQNDIYYLATQSNIMFCIL